MHRPPRPRITKEPKDSAKPLYRSTDYGRVFDILPRAGTELYRPAFRRDYGRLIHSPSFRRLQGKTQMFPGSESDFFRNRLTHSIEVAQIAKTIAMKLNATHLQLKDRPTEQQLDYDLIELAALAHDLGHPPFGHNGEVALDKCMKEYGGFEGNAQSLRILAKLEKKLDGGEPPAINDGNKDIRRGLNFAYRSLASVLKYDKPIALRRGTNDKFEKGYYDSEADLVKRIKDAVAPGFRNSKSQFPFKTVECCIMDIADDIAYSTYDLEDALKAEFLSPLRLLSLLAHDVDLRSRIAAKVNHAIGDTLKEAAIFNIIRSLFSEALGKLGTGESAAKESDEERLLRSFKSSDQLATNGYVRTEFTGALVSDFVEGIVMTYNPRWPALSKVKLTDEVRQKVEVLKHLTYEVIVMSSRLKLVEYRGTEVVKEIFDAISNTDKKGHQLLPSDRQHLYYTFSGTDDRMRTFCDFVAGMTDKYALEFHSRIKEAGQSLFKPF